MSRLHGGTPRGCTHCFEKPVASRGQWITEGPQPASHKKSSLRGRDGQIGKLCAEKGVSLVDVLLAGTNLAIDEWTGARNAARGF